MSEEIYSRGDWIVHSAYGVGQVKGKDIKILDGEKRSFLKVKTFTSVYFLPTKNWDVPHIRPLSSMYQMKKALSIMRKPPEPMKKDHKQRGKQISEALADISLYSKAEIIRDLSGRKKLGKLNVTEGELFEKTINEFVNEWSVVSDQEKEELREKLDKALEISFEKLKKEKDESWLEKVRKGVKERRKIKSTS
jgi:RNA polymerase-interacting CarD/CdnL/TRCF family regulator